MVQSYGHHIYILYLKCRTTLRYCILVYISSIDEQFHIDTDLHKAMLVEIFQRNNHRDEALTGSGNRLKWPFSEEPFARRGLY